MKNASFVFLIILMGCNSKKKDCLVTASEILNNNLDKVHAVYSEKHMILGISDNVNNSSKGGAYYFYNSGALQSYKFFQTDSAYSYNEEHDETGRLIKQDGSPIVDESIREVNVDSAVVKISLFALRRTYEELSVTIDNNNPFYSKLADDSLRSNLKMTSFGFNTKGLKDIKVFLSIQCINECSGKKEIFKDTISMIKNPRLNRN